MKCSALFAPNAATGFVLCKKEGVKQQNDSWDRALPCRWVRIPVLQLVESRRKRLICTGREMQTKNHHRRRRKIGEADMGSSARGPGLKNLSVSHLCPSTRRALVFFTSFFTICPRLAWIKSPQVLVEKTNWRSALFWAQLVPCILHQWYRCEMLTSQNHNFG